MDISPAPTHGTGISDISTTRGQIMEKLANATCTHGQRFGHWTISDIPTIPGPKGQTVWTEPIHDLRRKARFLANLPKSDRDWVQPDESDIFDELLEEDEPPDPRFFDELLEADEDAKEDIIRETLRVLSEGDETDIWDEGDEADFQDDLRIALQGF